METDSDSWNEGPRRLEDVLLSDTLPPAGRSIFFHETRCRSPYSQYILNLTARQACSIESAALHNPNFQVFVLFASSTYISDDQKNPLYDALKSYKNVNFRQLNIRRYAKDTPIEDWLEKRDLFRSNFLTEHTSDLLRLLTLYRFGGIYMDLDVVVLRSLENVPLNYVGAHDNITLGNAVISVEPRGIGHKIAELFLRDYQQHYNGNVYVSNGPSLISRVIPKYCNAKVKELLDNPQLCVGFHVFNSSAFFPLEWPQWTHFILPKFLNDTLARTKDSYLIHLWNKASFRTLFKVGSNNVYGKYAELHCPKSYAAAGQYF
ncbi:lactosylceramide 4-alpha-galactosyltransferase-like [Drosophila innubila]|uniref:lactosylceramide 4-alpha-galactosyltransferase-like n=1 Tax=Drosophila innubila TaxID=198719 RepID=UPI00148B9F44|nr:lactosylceramide 4-alpha-galactosyltransferase-like [Drosophila innubila]